MISYKDIRLDDKPEKIKRFLGLDKNVKMYFPSKKMAYRSGIIPIRFHGTFILILDMTIYVEKHNGRTRNVNYHNSNGPAIIHFNLNKQVTSVHWYKDGSLHNPLGPAYIRYRDGIIVERNHYLNGKLHNRVGPAYINYRANIFNYYLNGQLVSKEAFFKRC